MAGLGILPVGRSRQATVRRRRRAKQRCTYERLTPRSGELDFGTAGEPACLAPAVEHPSVLSTILDTLDDAVVIVDATGHALHANASFEHLLLDDGPTTMLLDGDGVPLTLDTFLTQRAARAEEADHEVLLLAPDGQRRLYHVTIRSIRPPAPEGAVGLVTFHDLHERQRRLHGEELLAHVGHELRTPVSGLQCYAELLTDYLGGDLGSPEAYAAIRRVHKLSQRLGDMIQELFDLSRITSERLNIDKEPIDLQVVVRSVVEIVESLPAAPRICIDAPSEAVMLLGDAWRLGDVLRNLLTNAIKHASGTERIDVRVRSDDTSAQVEVEDYGPGIPPEDLPLIFTKHYQARREATSAGDGLGLGLYIAQQVAVAHGGQLEVSSRLGAGSRFTLSLPRA